MIQLACQTYYRNISDVSILTLKINFQTASHIISLWEQQHILGTKITRKTVINFKTQNVKEYFYRELNLVSKRVYEHNQVLWITVHDN